MGCVRSAPTGEDHRSDSGEASGRTIVSPVRRRCRTAAHWIAPVVEHVEEDIDRARCKFPFEPDATLFEPLLPRYLDYFRVYAALLESAASELASRQSCSDGLATDNADDPSRP